MKYLSLSRNGSGKFYQGSSVVSTQYLQELRARQVIFYTK
jgi:hypothetical protein